jgi:hypothetical protein
MRVARQPSCQAPQEFVPPPALPAAAFLFGCTGQIFKAGVAAIRRSGNFIVRLPASCASERTKSTAQSQILFVARSVGRLY